MLPQLNIPLPPARSLKSPRAVAAHTNKNKLSPSHPCKGAIFPKLGARAVVINPAQPSLPSYPHPARCSARGWRVGCCSCTALSGLVKYLMVPKYDLIEDIIFILRVIHKQFSPLIRETEKRIISIVASIVLSHSLLNSLLSDIYRTLLVSLKIQRSQKYSSAVCSCLLSVTMLLLVLALLTNYRCSTCLSRARNCAGEIRAHKAGL